MTSCANWACFSRPVLFHSFSFFLCSSFSNLFTRFLCSNSLLFRVLVEGDLSLLTDCSPLLLVLLPGDLTAGDLPLSLLDESLLDEPLLGESLLDEFLLGEPLLADPLLAVPLLGDPLLGDDALLLCDLSLPLCGDALPLTEGGGEGDGEKLILPNLL